jgi:hypothetical protein
MSHTDRSEQVIQLVSALEPSLQFTENRGVTMDAYPIQPVSAPPAESAMPPNAPASASSSDSSASK